MSMVLGKEFACNSGDPGWDDPLEKEMATHSSIQHSCLENTKDRGTWQATVHGVARVGHDLVTKSSHHGLGMRWFILPWSNYLNVFINDDDYTSSFSHLTLVD